MGKTTKQKIAAIYDPYLDTLGGGEKYMFTIAQTLLENNYQVDIFTNQNKQTIDKLQSRFKLDLSQAKLRPDIFKQKGIKSIITKIKNTSKYDLFIYLNDGSIPLLFSKKNILHVQVPFNQTPNLTSKTTNLIKLSFFKKIIVNSKFTQKRVKQIYLTNSDLLYPPIDVKNFTPSKNKQNIILSIGRFDNILNAKRQDILIKAFKSMSQKNNLKKWRLILAGGSLEEESKNQYLTDLKYAAKGLPIEFIVNSPFTTIKKLYSISKIYWHAAGFGVNEKKNPQSTEHFGMTAVEAMSAGLVPIVINKGGLREIVNQGKDGYLWNKQDELITQTQFLIDHPKKLKQMSKSAQFTAQKFSVSRFKKKFTKIIK